jgi:hypothetical protein
MKRRSLGWVAIAAIALIASLMMNSPWQPVTGTAKASPFELVQAVPETTPAAPGMVVSGLYEDPQGNFQVGILEGYAVSTVVGSPLFQRGDGSLAYSVVKVPLNSETPLTDIGLAEVAQQTLGRGEGFQTLTGNPLPGGGLQIIWTGRLTQGAAPPQPVSGTVLVKQQGAQAYVLAVSALESAVPQVPQVVSVLLDTLKIL